ncbi:MAG: hypothetical protein ACKVZ0_03295 [Gemmatimonadales bacterium]
MTEPERNDEDLRELFAEARASESGWVPSFERVRDGRGQRRVGWRAWPWLVASTGLAAVVVAVVLTGRPGADSLESLPAGLAEMRSATDFLLEVPGAENLSSVPRIGDVNGWFSLEGTEKGRL